ncbi:MAG: sugar nucleotide-binding protein [Patescibacteria group bacterium]|nr:sugar nucleotide-binding protein [Patescibacteria group bacterium]
MKILIYGKGYVGSRIKDQYPDAVFGVSDIRNQDTVRKEILDIHPDIVINTAAKIGTRKPVECEDYPEETMEVNAIAPEKIAQICQEENIFFVHISTGYLYSGDNDGKGFFEEDTPNFVHGIYSQSKYEAEQNLQKYMENTAILRINKPVDCKSYSDNPSRNQLEKIGSYNKVFDMKTNITYIPFFLEVLAIIIQKRDT